MTHRVPESFDRLSGQDTSRCIGHCAGHHHGQTLATGLEDFFDCKNSRLGVQRIKNRFNQNQVDTTIEQAVELLGVGRTQFLKGHITRTGIVDIRRDRGGFRLRAQGTRNKARTLKRTELITRDTCQACGLQIQLISELGQIIVTLGNRGRTKGVGFYDIGTGLEIPFVNRLNDVRTHDRQQFIVALDVFAMLGETRASKIRFG